MAGKGEEGARGGPPGDLYVFIRVRPHEVFQRHETDVVIHVPIAMHEAALGTNDQRAVAGRRG
ncbi:MAG: hypothetical protein M5R36_30015 [Deltaproteobacteria bacterium]|nr:hypothetical protein [Deltaproteobacteria bacterium]